MMSDLLRLAAIIMLGLTLAGCNRAEMRTRMTVEVETPDGVRSGSSVLSIAGGEEAVKLPDSGPIHLGLRGEAVAVDLPNGETLFALLRPERGSSDQLLIAIIEAIEPGNQTGTALLDKVARLGRSEGKSGILPPSEYPIFVRFRNIDGPMTVERVDPASLVASFGEGYRLRGFTLTVTEDPVTRNLAKKISWLPNIYDHITDESFSPKGIPVGDYRGLFTTENYK